MLRETGCDGVMIGRGALAAPWIFRDVDHYLSTGELLADPTLAEKVGTVRRYFELMREHRDDRYAMWQIVRRISWYAKKMAALLPDGRMESVRPFKEAVRNAAGPDEVHAALDLFLGGGLRGGAEQLEPSEQESA
jgi:tRNA-dihydrouridine synthase